MNQKINKYMSMAAAFAICSAMMSCSSDTVGNVLDNKTSSAAQESILVGDTASEGLYSASAWELPEEIKVVLSLTEVSDGAVISAYDEEENRLVFHANGDFSSYMKYELREYKESDVIIPASSDDGRLYLLVNSVTYKGLPDPDYDDPNTDWAMYEEAAVYSSALDVYDENGKFVSTTEITGLDDEFLSQGYIGDCTALSDGSFAINSRGKIAKIDTDAKVIGTGKIDCDYSGISVLDSEGSLVINCDNTLYNIDADTLEIVSTDSLDETSWIRSMACGKGEYRLFVAMYDGIYGIKSGSKKLFKIADTVNSGLNSEGADMFMALGEDDFVTIGNVSSGDSVKADMNHLRLLSEEEQASLQIITLAALNGLNEEDLADINDFNKSHEGKYKIEVKTDYGATSKEDTGEAFSKALMAGEAPDLVHFFDISAMQNLASMEALADLYPFIENDPELSKDIFMPNLLKACEYGDELPFLPVSFYVETLAVKTKFAEGAGENWTGNEMMSAVAAMPDGMVLDSFCSDGESVLWKYLFHACGSYVDYENRTCSFDSPGFVALLEAAGTAPMAEEFNDADMTPDEVQQSYDDRENACKNDKALISPLGICDYQCYKQNKEDLFGTDDITWVGYPSENGKGAYLGISRRPYAIIENSPNKDAAWEFLRTLYLEKYQTEKKDQAICAVKKYNDLGDKSYEDYILSVDTIGTYDYDIYNICLDEASYYFSGEHTAQQAADLIQNRVSILISEQSW